MGSLSRVWALDRVSVFVYLTLKYFLGLRPWAAHTYPKFMRVIARGQQQQQLLLTPYT